MAAEELCARMYFRRFEIQDYRCFGSRVTAAFGAGINVICGKNNSGKSSLLEALTLEIQPASHRSLKTQPALGPAMPGSLAWAVSVTLTPDELVSFSTDQSMALSLPVPKLASDFAKSIGYTSHERADLNRLRQWFTTQQEFTLRLSFENGRVQPISPTDFGYPPEGLQGMVCRWIELRLLLGQDAGPMIQNADLGPMAQGLTKALKSRIQLFSALRLANPNMSFAGERTLAPDGNNLVAALDNLQRNHWRFDRFNKLVSEVLPEVQRVSVRSINPSSGEIVIWNHDFASEREDLAIPLNQSGTGVSHVLAMMYVLVTAEESRVVLIDEPQSFLHPSAVRRLFGAFKLLPKHQFIVSTHSPQAISAADPVNVTVVRRSEAESVLDNLDMQLNGSQRFLLDELGASLGDVFGADSILWVEGATEGVCFPRILQKISKRSLLGTIIKPMRATGDATGKHAAVVLDIYKKMSAGVGLIPVFLGFLFDREERGPQEIAELVRASEGLFRFLDRRAYENYLLNPTAISGTINKVHPEVEPVSDSEVATLIAELRHEAKYFHPLPLAESDWKSTIHAGKLLKEVFWRLRSLDYRKTTHSVALTDWLICNEPADLKELAGELDSILIR